MSKKQTEWIKIQTKNSPTKRCAHTASFYKNKLLVLPGFEFEGTSTTSTELPFYNFITRDWQTIHQENVVPKRQQAISFNYKNNLFIFGGSEHEYTNFFDRYSNSIHKYSFEENTWEEVIPKNLSEFDVPSPRFKHTGCRINDSLIIYGGSNPETNSLFNDVYEYNLIKNEWKNLVIKDDEKVPITARMALCSTTDEENMFLFGGKCTITEDRFNSLYKLDLKNKKWIHLPKEGNFPSERAGSTLNYFKSNLYLFGGFNGENDVNEFYCYNLISEKWNQIILNFPPLGRSFHTTNLIFDRTWKLITFGGLYEEFTRGGSTVDINNLNQFLALLSNNEAYHNDLLIYNLENESIFEFIFLNLKNEVFTDSIFIFQN
eukprot:gene1106-10620_t